MFIEGRNFVKISGYYGISVISGFISGHILVWVISTDFLWGQLSGFYFSHLSYCKQLRCFEDAEACFYLLG